MAYLAAAHAVADLVRRIPPGAWDGPGLGDWNLRDLVGHTSRSLVTVIEYFDRPVDREEIADAADYYVAAAALLAVADDSVVERGREAGRALGEDPAGRFAALVEEAAAVVARTDPDRVVHTIVGGMTTAAYLPTRTFELVVHGLDLARATGLPLALPAEAVEEAVVVAAQVTARTGRAPDLLLALTGREPLAADFSIL